MDDPLETHNLERLRRSIAMLQTDRPDALSRNKALLIIAALQRLQERDRRYTELVGRLRALLEAADRP